jgi:acetyl esterase/lipase
VAGEAGRAANRWQTKLKPSKERVYKKVGDVELKLHIFEPKGHKPSDRRPAVVFFFGGGWTSGDPRQFYPQCNYLASRGMVAMSAEYRVRSRNNTTPLECVKDAKSAIRWVRAHADELGVDPNRIAAGGGSAGGHIAACTGTIEGLDEEGEKTSVSSKPDAMVLFNPVLVLDSVEGKLEFNERRREQFRRRGVDNPRTISPAHHVKSGLPPTIVFHGTGDRTVPYRTAEIYSELAKAEGNRCELVSTEGAGHGFFNYGRNGNRAYVSTLRAADRFLASLGWLEGEPTLEEKP